MTQTTSFDHIVAILSPNLTLFEDATSKQPLRVAATSGRGNITVEIAVLIGLHKRLDCSSRWLYSASSSAVVADLISGTKEINEAFASGTRRMGATSNAAHEAHTSLIIQSKTRSTREAGLIYFTLMLTRSKNPVESRALWTSQEAQQTGASHVRLKQL